MAIGKINFNSPTGIYKNGNIVGETDRAYSPENGYFNIGEITLKGDMNGELEYAGHKIIVEHIDTAIGMLMGAGGPRGPIWRGVKCKIV